MLIWKSILRQYYIWVDLLLQILELLLYCMLFIPLCSSELLFVVYSFLPYVSDIKIRFLEIELWKINLLKKKWLRLSLKLSILSVLSLSLLAWHLPFLPFMLHRLWLVEYQQELSVSVWWGLIDCLLDRRLELEEKGLPKEAPLFL